MDPVFLAHGPVFLGPWARVPWPMSPIVLANGPGCLGPWARLSWSMSLAVLANGPGCLGPWARVSWLLATDWLEEVRGTRGKSGWCPCGWGGMIILYILGTQAFDVLYISLFRPSHTFHYNGLAIVLYREWEVEGGGREGTDQVGNEERKYELEDKSV